MRLLFLLFLLQLSSCIKERVVTIEQVHSSSSYSSRQVSSLFEEEVIVAITNEIMNAIQKENCSIADEYILEVNDLFCYIEAYKFLTSKSEMSELEITVINELTRKIIDSWNRIFPIEVPASMINTRELLRRYIDNEQMDTTTDISFSCDSQFFPLLCEQ